MDRKVWEGSRELEILKEIKEMKNSRDGVNIPGRTICTERETALAKFSLLKDLVKEVEDKGIEDEWIEKFMLAMIAVYRMNILK